MPLTLQDVRAKFPQYKDLSDEQLVQGLHQKFYSQMPFDQFAKQVGYDPGMSAGDVAKGVVGGVSNALLNLPYGMVHGANDLARRLGAPIGTGLEDFLHVRPPKETTELGQRIANSEPMQAVSGVVNDYGNKIANAIGPTATDIAGHTAQVGSDVASVLPGVGAMKTAAALPELLASGAARTAAAEGGATPAARAGLTAGGESPIAEAVAGDTGKRALTGHNQAIGNLVAANEAGHVGTAPLSYQTLAAAREAPSAVYNRVAAALPEGGLDAQAQAEIANAGLPEGGRMSKGSPKAQTDIEALRSQLTGPRNFTGEQMVNELRGLRQEGYTNVASDDVSNQQLGRAQLDMARAIEGHIGRNLPAGGDVSLEQFQQARVALAKNHAVEGALRGNDVDLQALARVQRADPEMMTGGLNELANFANANRDVTTLHSGGYGEPSIAQDIAGVTLKSPTSWVRALGAGPLARRAITGSTSDALERANRMFPAAGADRFAPLPGPSYPGGVPFAPPEGPGPLSASPPGAPPAAPAGAPGQLSLADLLSHGVEQGPSPGLSLAQEPGAGGPYSPQGGIPFRAPAGHLAGDLQLPEHPEDAWFSGPRENVSDLPKVMSQGVPEGTVARAQQPRRVAALQFPGGQPTSMLANNASGESAASLEAIRRGTRNIVRYDGESAEPVLRDVTQVDRGAPKGAIHIDADTGEIVSRGSNLNQRQATALRNRWASENRKVPLAEDLTGS